MKKAAIIFLAVLYFTMSNGVIVNFHYCMGDLAEVAWGYKHSDTCPKCGMKDAKGCCENKYEVIKVQQEHQQAEMALILPSFAVASPSFSFLPVNHKLQTASPCFNSFEGPPGVKRHLLHQVFLI
jgi:hypothetical protein